MILAAQDHTDETIVERLTSQTVRLNEYLGRRQVRRYQRDIWEKGRFELILDGADAVRLTFVRSILVARNELWYGAIAAETGEEWWLLTGAIAEAYPILAVVRFSEAGNAGELTRLTDFKSASPEVLKAKLQRFIACRHGSEIDWSAALSPELAIGHVNFAHLAWNEIPALEYLLTEADRAAACSSVRVEHQPLGQLQELFPELADFSVEPVDEGQNLNRPDRFMFRVAGSLFTDSAKQRIRRRVEGGRPSPKIGAFLAEVRRRQAFVVWITVRTKNRTALNQADFIRKLVMALLQRPGETLIVLHGFSPPLDYGSAHARQKNWSLRVKESMLRMRDYIEDVVSELSPEVRNNIFIAGEYDIVETIHLAKCASYYVAQPGTAQHIVGWFWETPGVILAPAQADRIRDWYLHVNESGRAADIVDGNHFELIESESGKYDRNSLYRICDTDALSAGIKELTMQVRV
ncbi:hypothetical protein [Microbaculum marinum]|uniref:Uncharacterized protein n=1 Tax=Microbaculum marinum TaxID=1764581 RepID=A0AAW9RRM6_9HYPH